MLFIYGMGIQIGVCVCVCVCLRDPKIANTYAARERDTLAYRARG